MIDTPEYIKQKLKTSMYYSVYTFTTDDNKVISNDNLVSESVTLTERMCSTETLKFGLCEGNDLEFQYFDTDSNQIGDIKGKTITAVFEVWSNRTGAISRQLIPLGKFKVVKTSREFKTGIVKAECYNKLSAEYLDVNVFDDIKAMFDNRQKIPLFEIVETLLEDKNIQPVKIEGELNIVDFRNISYSWGAVPLRMCQPGTETPVQPFQFLWTMYVEADLVFNEQINSQYSYNMSLDGYSASEDAMEEFYSLLYRDYSFQGRESQTSEYWWEQNFRTLMSTPEHRFIFDGTYAVSDGSTRWLYHKLHDPVKTTYPTNETGWKIGSDFNNITIKLPVYFYVHTSETSAPTISTYMRTDGLNRFKRIVLNNLSFGMQKRYLSAVERHEVELPDFGKTDSVTIRQLQSSMFELDCKYGKLDRVTDQFYGYQLTTGELYPADNRYPSDSLYPSGAVEMTSPDSYEKLWTDNAKPKIFKTLMFSYNTDYGTGQEHIVTLPFDVQTFQGNEVYDCTDNWLMNNLIWRPEIARNFANEMANALLPYSWVPFEMDCAGLPYVEAGDAISITDENGTHISYILSRELRGIQNLKDTYINGSVDIF